MNTVRELYHLFVKEDLPHMVAYIEFLVYEKKVISLDDTTNVLRRYESPKNRDRMNQLVTEYQARRMQSAG